MKNSEADARRWLRQAESDLAAAQLLLREGFFAHACFMAQQVAEKALKALAYRRGDRYVTGHSVADLVANLISDYPALTGYQDLAGTLDQYYVPTRYPNALPGSVPSEVYHRGQAEDAVKGTADVVNLAKRLVEQAEKTV